jgi:hypothetical protein
MDESFDLDSSSSSPIMVYPWWLNIGISTPYARCRQSLMKIPRNCAIMGQVAFGRP